MHRSTAALAIKSLLETAAQTKPGLLDSPQLLSLRNFASNVAILDSLRSQGFRPVGEWAHANCRSFASLPAEAPAGDRNSGPRRPQNRQNNSSRPGNANRGPPGAFRPRNPNQNSSGSGGGSTSNNTFNNRNRNGAAGRSQDKLQQNRGGFQSGNRPGPRSSPWWERNKPGSSATSGQQQQRPQQQQQQQTGSGFRPAFQRRPAVRPVPWWERNKVQQEQQAALQAKHAKQERSSQIKNQRKVPKEAAAIVIPHDVTVARLAHLFGVEIKELEKVLTELGDPPHSEEDSVPPDAAELAALELGKNAVLAAPPSGGKASKGHTESDTARQLPPRPAVVTVMGHVDHGKTTLLDALRKTSVAAREAGGITQHVGAFEVSMPGSGQSLTFLDTPGHAAFSAMRARGAAVTDLVVLVVAADDGVMPQTKEALAHAQAAGCPIVVAITKCDLPAANPGKVEQQLATAGLLVEGHGGNVQVIEVAATTGQGLAELEEALLLEGEMLELTADPDIPATGTVIEARLDRGQGPLATVIVTRGTLKVGNSIVVGTEWGKVRALKTPGGEAVGKKGVLPGRPAEVVGLKGLPQAGDELMAVASEERAQKMSKARTDRSELHRRADLGKLQTGAAGTAATGIDRESETKVMPIVIKADVQGSAEAVKEALANLSSKDVRVHVVHAGVGPITLSDVSLAVPSGAKVIGFNVKVASEAENEAKAHGVQVVTRRVIYELLGDVGTMIEGLTPRALEEVIVGSAEVLATFQVTLKGREKRTIAGCRVEDGILRSGLKIKVLRGGEVIAEGVCDSLKRHKLDVDTVGQGTECGLGLEGFEGFQAGDVLQCVDEK